MYVCPRPTQASERPHGSALLEAAARGLSRYGYGNLVLEDVAHDAGYTRGALYHQFKDKEDLALAVVDWVDETLDPRGRRPGGAQPEPVAALLALARGHAVFCRRDIARVVMALRVEFSGQDHPVGREIERVSATLRRACRAPGQGGASGRLDPAGPPARRSRKAFLGALEGTAIALAGQAPHDEMLAGERPRACSG